MDAEGGTTSPLRSIKHAGIPWEMGLSETHQVLVMNDLRGRVTLTVDGGFQRGFDVVVASYLRIFMNLVLEHQFLLL